MSEDIQGLVVDTFKEFVLLTDTDFDDEFPVMTRMTVDEAYTLAYRIIRAANKASLYL